MTAQRTESMLSLLLSPPLDATGHYPGFRLFSQRSSICETIAAYEICISEDSHPSSSNSVLVANTRSHATHSETHFAIWDKQRVLSENANEARTKINPQPDTRAVPYEPIRYRDASYFTDV